MRGLTDEERDGLLGEGSDSEPLSHACYQALTARGLIVDGPCVGCGAAAGAECRDGCDSELGETVLTPRGCLAIRLDNAARGVGVVRG